jgi:hypothetical protein
MALLPDLRPLDTSLGVEDLAADTEAQAVCVELQAIAPYCPCPSCHMPAERIHSHYRRTAAQHHALGLQHGNCLDKLRTISHSGTYW